MNTIPDPPRSKTGNEALAIATRAAQEAGAILKRHFRHGEKRVTIKGKRNLVTEADLLAERSILELLRYEYPEHGIISEESGKTASGSEYRWIIDPLDGTTNYAFGIPIFTVSIALVRNDDLLVGVVYDPLRDEMFAAQKGKGAFLNGSKISVAKERGFGMAVMGFDLGYDDLRTREMLSLANDLWSDGTTFRLIGSAALGITYVACGRIDIYFHRRIYPWDIAAAMLLVREAGGEMTEWKGCPASVWDTSIIACGDAGKHADMVAALRKPFQ